ncbi:unnamed protein product, partial [Amoebophrya sp. A25]
GSKPHSSNSTFGSAGSTTSGKTNGSTTAGSTRTDQQGTEVQIFSPLTRMVRQRLHILADLEIHVGQARIATASILRDSQRLAAWKWLYEQLFKDGEQDAVAGGFSSLSTSGVGTTTNTGTTPSTGISTAVSTS